MSRRTRADKAGSGYHELRHKDDLCSPQWDHRDNVPLRARYAVFSAQRTGSEWLCDHLRQCGIGVPFEYFNHTFALRIGDRLGCTLPGNLLFVERYTTLLEPLRSRHGIFGTKLQPDQLRSMSNGSDAKAVTLLRRFDRLIVLGRRDKLLQAISLARAHLTDQWQLYRSDDPIGIAVADDVLFRMIDERLAKLAEDDRYMSELVGKLDAQAVRMLWYEDLKEPGALENVSEGLWTALGGAAPRPQPDRSLAVARRMDEAEAFAIKRRYLAAIAAAP